MQKTTEIGELLARLIIDAPGLEKVKGVIDRPDAAARELLAYYRSRDSIRHFVDRREKADRLGKNVSQSDIAIADSALKHFFIGQPAYPPYFCGDDID